ncbi:3-hydroxybutyryl-CoA dehydrogenase [Kurthia zopfii]|uniref:3-hydroxybutyryl-CoA dehydrogenase n=1 Tax=Kurthia zopfii TaxID=1650 RepID=A0A8B4QED6_9BACL|nr:3-hydroxyacyl-CoA dehydrogenase [Kurthia zopfii]PWI21479.1 3-hydroxyacyl-CoA dehydrogenase [Kurthia zopfii]TDR34536.1 3-hydroxybutyryl-CoA dehydrogenase [Kurthia zopfii]GEK31635.1 3-hydroxybutyryl-CoA dehydrogenase [Kurthia zopfii]STX11009.1 Probable 3-hydroxybutyryl-CoA dehydrogenase [Kurthia zopfii]
MNFKNVTVAGSGVLGSQIAFQTAFKGFEVNVYDINDAAIEAAKERANKLAIIYKNDVAQNDAEVEAALGRLSFYTDLGEAVQNADLVIEAIPERLDIKQGFYEQLSKVAPAKTVFATNSSTMIPSQFRQFTDRTEKFLALHFANEIWKNNTAEIMGHDATDKQYEEQVIEFARAIGMVPLHILKEQPGYILNSLLVPFLNAAQSLYAHGVADPHTIDKTWMIATSAPRGPFAILDVVGLETAYNIVAAHAVNNPTAAKIAELIKAEYIDKGKLGIATGEGFYKYPNPAFEEPDFLK